MKEKNNACHMRIELTRERYATLCAKAKKSGLTKSNSATKRPERVRRFCKAVLGKYPGTLGGALLWVSTKALPLFRRPISPN